MPAEVSPLSDLFVSLPVDLARRVDLLCDEFERQWRHGRRPDPNTPLARAPAGLGEALRQERPALWRGDGEQVEEVRPGGSEHVGISALKGIGPLGQALRQLREGPGVDALAGVALVVGPNVGN
jgi:hypothetical protein